MVKSENAEKRKVYRILKKDGSYMGMPGAREFKVVKTFEQTETGVIFKNTKHGYQLDIPIGYYLEEVEK